MSKHHEEQVGILSPNQIPCVSSSSRGLCVCLVRFCSLSKTCVSHRILFRGMESGSFWHRLSAVGAAAPQEYCCDREKPGQKYSLWRQPTHYQGQNSSRCHATSEICDVVYLCFQGCRFSCASQFSVSVPRVMIVKENFEISISLPPINFLQSFVSQSVLPPPGWVFFLGKGIKERSGLGQSATSRRKQTRLLLHDFFHSISTCVFCFAVRVCVLRLVEKELLPTVIHLCD